MTEFEAPTDEAAEALRLPAPQSADAAPVATATLQPPLVAGDEYREDEEFDEDGVVPVPVPVPPGSPVGKSIGNLATEDLPFDDAYASDDTLKNEFTNRPPPTPEHFAKTGLDGDIPAEQDPPVSARASSWQDPDRAEDSEVEPD